MARKKETRIERFKTKPKGMPGDGAGCYLNPEYVTSEAFAGLNGTDIQLLIGFLRRRRTKSNAQKRRQKRKYFMNEYTNLSEIIYHLDAMVYETNTAKPNVLKSRQTLMERGFVVLRDQVDWGKHQNNRWEITDRFLLWHPDAEQRTQNGFIEHLPIRKKDAPHSPFPKKQQKEIPVLSVAFAN